MSDTLDKIFKELRQNIPDLGVSEALEKAEEQVADREKEMLEFVKPDKRDKSSDEDEGLYNYGYNQAIADMSQRAKEWEER